MIIYYNFMKFCWLAIIVLQISILGMLFDIYFFGFSIVYFLINTIFTVLVVFITNWSCYSTKYSSIAWIIFSISFMSMIISLIMVNTEFGRDIIEVEQKYRL